MVQEAQWVTNPFYGKEFEAWKAHFIISPLKIYQSISDKLHFYSIMSKEKEKSYGNSEKPALALKNDTLSWNMHILLNDQFLIKSKVSDNENPPNRISTLKLISGFRNEAKSLDLFLSRFKKIATPKVRSSNPQNRKHENILFSSYVILRLLLLSRRKQLAWYISGSIIEQEKWRKAQIALIDETLMVLVSPRAKSNINIIIHGLDFLDYGVIIDDNFSDEKIKDIKTIVTIIDKILEADLSFSRFELEVFTLLDYGIQANLITANNKNLESNIPFEKSYKALLDFGKRVVRSRSFYNQDFFAKEQVNWTSYQVTTAMAMLKHFGSSSVNPDENNSQWRSIYETMYPNSSETRINYSIIKDLEEATLPYLINEVFLKNLLYEKYVPRDAQDLDNLDDDNIIIRIKSEHRLNTNDLHKKQDGLLRLNNKLREFPEYEYLALITQSKNDYAKSGANTLYFREMMEAFYSEQYLRFSTIAFPRIEANLRRLIIPDDIDDQGKYLVLGSGTGILKELSKKYPTKLTYISFIDEVLLQGIRGSRHGLNLRNDILHGIVSFVSREDAGLIMLCYLISVKAFTD